MSGNREPLVGRDCEVSVLDGLLVGAHNGAGKTLLIQADAGLGKTRLLDLAVDEASDHGLVVLRASAVPAEQNVPFAVVLQLFEPLLASESAKVRAELLAGAARLAAPIFTDEYGQIDMRTQFPLLHGLFWLTVNLTQRHPLLVCVDDAQWSDTGSMSYLYHLARRISGLPVLLIVAARETSSNPNGTRLAQVVDLPATEHLPLRALDRSAVAELIRIQVPAADDAFCDRCADVTRGNPFYLGELLRALAADGLEPSGATTGRLQEMNVESIGRAMRGRLARLDDDAIALARALAILGDQTPLQLAAALAGGLEFEVAVRAARALATEHIVTYGSTLSFEHPLVGQQIRDDLAAFDVEVGHLQAAHLLGEQHQPPEVIAAHLLLAPCSADPWAVRQLRLASRRAQSTGASETAVLYLRRALMEPPRASDRAAVLMELGAAETAAGAGTAADHLREAITLLVAPRRIEGMRLLAQALAATGNRQGAADVLEHALDEAASSDPADRTGVTQTLIVDYLAHAVFEPGLRQRAIERAARTVGEEPSPATPQGRTLLALLAMRSGQSAQPAEQSARLARLAWADGELLRDQSADGAGWLMVVWALEFADAHREADAVAGAAMDAARLSGTAAGFATASFFRGSIRIERGHLVEARADLEQILAVAGQSSWSRYLVGVYSRLTEVLLEQAEWSAAEESLKRAHLHQADGIEIPCRLVASARMEFARQRPGAALKLFEAAGEWLTDQLVVEHTVVPWRVGAAHAALVIGERERARRLIAAEAELAQQTGALGDLGRVGRVNGLLSGGDQGLHLLREAAERFEAAGEKLQHARALTDLGAMLRRQGNRARAREPLATAVQLSLESGALVLSARARVELEAAGGRPRTHRLSGADALTPSERRVAEFVTEGLTNNQVAQALFVTPKTIEFHLRHVYQKLGVSGRRQLPGALSAVPYAEAQAASAGTWPTTPINHSPPGL